jgi:hypothetical protein
VKPIAAQPRRSASSTVPVIAWSFEPAFGISEFAELHLRISGICPAKVSAPASIMPMGAA